VTPHLHVAVAISFFKSGFLMRVWGDTEIGGSKILGFQIPRTEGYVFSNLLLLGNENLKM
jgi:hypothetical protein